MKASEGQDRSKTEVSRAAITQNQSRPKADQAHIKEEAKQSKRGQDREEAREEHGGVMPKIWQSLPWKNRVAPGSKDLSLVKKLPQVAVRRSLWYVSQVVTLCATKRDNDQRKPA